MPCRLLLPFAVAAALAATTDIAPAGAPANTLNELFAELGGCTAHVAVESGTEVTVQFSINRRGGLIGKPRLTYARWTGSADDQKRSAAAIAGGFDHCFPLAITDGLGGAIAGRMITFRLRGGAGKEQNT